MFIVLNFSNKIAFTVDFVNKKKYLLKERKVNFSVAGLYQI